jgi:predicted nucleic acid-binding protein
MPLFVDSNVFHYAAGSDHPYRTACQEVLRRIAGGRIDGITNTEVVQELVYVLERRGRRADGLRLARKVMALFPSLLPVTAADMRTACDLLERHPGVSPRDAIHAATMLGNHIGRIVTTDRHFDLFPGIERLDPLDMGASDPQV